MLNLIPMPKSVKMTDGKIVLSSLENVILPEPCPSPLLHAVVTLADEAETVTKKRIRFARSGVAGISFRMKYDKSVSCSEGYDLCISADGIVLSASAWTGFFYGIQTIRQLIRTEGACLPAVKIKDEPDFAARGFYHDATRGKVPTLDTLFKLVDKLAYYKINQFQLYIEHTFAFARHSDMWSGADPLTAEEILRLDDYCADRNVELVPSLSTFGHFYMGLRSKRKEDLNELDIKASELPFSFSGRMMHYTLNASDPRSIALVEDMLAEFLPLFRSHYFNICCDETFDLGKGKNAKLAKTEAGKSKLYVSFLKKIIAAVNKYGKAAMFWGDIIAQAPKLIKELPKDTIPLEWDYGKDAASRDTSIMQKSGLNYYICPGVSGWNRFLDHLDRGSYNIINYAKKGKKYGACGLLNTDWGDYGHINMLSCSYHGMALGAACGWNVKDSMDLHVFDKVFSLVELGDKTGDIVSAWRKASEAEQFTYAHLQWFCDPEWKTLDTVIRDLNKIKPAKIKAALDAHEKGEQKMIAAFANAHPLDPLSTDEILCGIRGNLLMHKAMIVILKRNQTPEQIWKLADELRAFEVTFSALWHKRNKPSEYYRVKEILMKVSEKMDAIAGELK